MLTKITDYKRKDNQYLWITWERQRRTIELSNHFQFNLIIFEGDGIRLIKHPIFIYLTWKVIKRHSPKYLIVQNPSIFLTLFVAFIKPLFKYKLIVDAHNPGLIPDYKILKLLNFLYKFMQQKADLTIVTNENLAQHVLMNEGVPFVLPDRIPQLISPEKVSLSNRLNIVCISTFDKDEPVSEIFKAAKKLGTVCHFYITGNHKRTNIQKFGRIPGNLSLTGFISEKDYWNLLYSADLIVDLTTRDDCMVCGAYEAVSVQTPVILSDTEVLKNYFTIGTVFVKNNAESIVTGIEIAVNKLSVLKKQIEKLKNKLNSEWFQTAGRLEQKLKSL